jgi:hypothetical protein
MIVISAGMVKSGSLWYYRLIDELLVASKKKTDLLAPTHEPIEAFHQGDKIKSGLTFSELNRLSKSARLGFSYPVKTHSAPTLSLPLFGSLTRGIKISYIYRDPRDVVLSVLDHAKKAREQDIRINLRDITSFSQAVDFVEVELVKWKKWKIYASFFEVHMVKYEHLVDDTMSELKRLAAFLRLNAPEEKLKHIIKKHSRQSNKEIEKITNRTHLNKGIAKRYLEEMDQGLLNHCERRFMPYLEDMGYQTT